MSIRASASVKVLNGALTNSCYMCVPVWENAVKVSASGVCV